MNITLIVISHFENCLDEFKNEHVISQFENCVDYELKDMMITYFAVVESAFMPSISAYVENYSVEFKK